MTPMHLRYLCFGLFIGVIVFSISGVYRSFRNKQVDHDEARCGFFFAAVVNCGFNFRWLVAPLNDNVTVMMQCMAAALAIYYLILLTQWRKARKRG